MSMVSGGRVFFFLPFLAWLLPYQQLQIHVPLVSLLCAKDSNASRARRISGSSFGFFKGKGIIGLGITLRLWV